MQSPRSTGKGLVKHDSLHDWWPHDFETRPSLGCSERFPQKTGGASSTICITQPFSDADATVKIEGFKGMKQLQQRCSCNKIIIVFHLSI